jgi:hypothetical protein
MMMKKKLLAVSLITAFSFAACKKAEQPAPDQIDEPAVSAPESETLTPSEPDMNAPDAPDTSDMTTPESH